MCFVVDKKIGCQIGYEKYVNYGRTCTCFFFQRNTIIKVIIICAVKFELHLECLVDGQFSFDKAHLLHLLRYIFKMYFFHSLNYGYRKYTTYLTAGTCSVHACLLTDLISSMICCTWRNDRSRCH